ncbi:MAG: hypothetical protein ACYC9L_08540 [Sulfuricaulis sp.]
MIYTATLLGLTAGIFATDACADTFVNWMIQPPEKNSISTAEAIIVGLPGDLSSAEIASLGIEVDNIDVTALAHISGGKLTYTPPQPLEAGQHELDVVEYASDGHLIPRGHWTFAVTSAVNQTGAQQNWTVKGNLGATASERIADSNLTPPAPRPFTANGTFDVKAARTMSEWTAEASVNGLYGSDNGVAADAGHAFQPGQIQFALKHNKDSLIFGDQTLPYDNLAISGLSRRGVSAHVGDIPLGTEASVFSMRDSPLVGFNGGLGFSDSNDNVSGALLQSHPLQAAPKALTLLAGYVTGTSPGGNGVSPASTLGSAMMPVNSGSGSAWVVGVNSEIPGSTVRLNSQYAGSTYDFPGVSGQSATLASGNAYSLSLNHSYPLSKQWMLNDNASYQKVGTFFSSLANPTLAPDQRTATIGGTLSGEGLMLAASGGFSEDNTNGNAAIPTVRTLPRSLTVSYGPALPATVTSWLGTPSLSLARQQAHTHNVTQPAGSQVTDSDIVNNNASLNFAYTHVSWQAGWTDGSFRDHTGQQDNTDTFGPTLGLNVSSGSSWSVGLNAQVVDSHDLKQDTHSFDNNYSITAADSILPNKLSAQLTLTINHNIQQVTPGMIPPQLVGNSLTLKTATAQLIWHALPATPLRGGLDVGLSSSWNESSGFNSAALTTQGFSSLATQGYQTFLTLSTTWPIDIGE